LPAVGRDVPVTKQLTFTIPLRPRSMATVVNLFAVPPPPEPLYPLVRKG
jgi:hypothetical protein